MAYITSRKHAVARAIPPLSGAAAALLALALPAGAQTAAQTLKEIRVQDTAPNDYKAKASANPKFTAPLVDTPQTLSIIKKEILQEQGAVSLSEALRNTPGITFQLGENGNTQSGDSISMRGFDTQGSIYVDGIRDLGSVTRDVFNVEQVEVIKGPAGADVGRAAASGYINLVSKLPQAENAFSGSLGFGSADRHRITADLNRSFNDGSAAFRLNLLEQNGGVAGRDWVKNKSVGVAPSVAFGLNTPTRVYLSYLYTKQDNRPDGGVPTVGLPGYSYTLTPGAKATAAEQALMAQQSFAGRLAPAVDPSNFYGSTQDFDHVDAHMFTARVEHDFSPTTKLRNTFRYGKLDQLRMATSIISPSFTIPGDLASYTYSRNRGDGQNRNSDGGQGRDQTNEIITNQTNLTSEFQTGSVKHSLTTGLELIRENQNKRHLMNATGGTGVNQGTVPEANLYHPDPSFPLWGYHPQRNGAFDKGETTTIGVYAFDTLKLNDAFQLSGGLRLDKYRTTFSSLRLAGTSTAGGSGVKATNANTAVDLRSSGTLVSWKVGAIYKPAPNGSVYVSYAASQRPPGGDSFSLSGNATNGDNPMFNPQKSTNFEIGTKWDLYDDRLALTAAVFDTVNKNENVTDAATGIAYQVGKRRVRGIELGVVGQITPAWQISAGYAHLNAKVLNGTTGDSGTTDGPLQWTPKNAFTAWSTYKLPFGLTVGGGARYQDGVSRSSAANVAKASGLARSASYWVVDGLLGYEINRNVSLQFNVYNVFDKKYVASFNNGGGRYTPGTPRSYLLTANVKF